MSERNEQAKVTLVVPFLNESEVLPTLVERVKGVFAGRGERWELLLVDDGSTDGGAEWAVEQAKADDRIRVVRLSRNFGHQAAITAGMDLSDGDAVVIMDADLQDPPEVIPDLLAKWREGAEVVYAVRRSRAGEGWMKKFLAAAFYRTFHRMAKVEVPMDAGDFRLVDRRVADALREMRETHRFVRGLTCWVGFRQAAVEYDRAARLAGETKYPVWKSARLAFDAITSFSAAPLRWMTAAGAIVCAWAVLQAAWVVVTKLAGWGDAERGWSSLAAIMLFLGGMQLLGLGMIGQYVSRIFEEGKRRPLYLVREDTGDRR